MIRVSKIALVYGLWWWYRLGQSGCVEGGELRGGGVDSKESKVAQVRGRWC